VEEELNIRGIRNRQAKVSEGWEWMTMALKARYWFRRRKNELCWCIITVVYIVSR
jgi:hypothetical protein